MSDSEIKKFYLIGREDEKNDTVTDIPEEALPAYEAGLTDEREGIELSWKETLEFIKEEMEEL